MARIEAMIEVMIERVDNHVAMARPLVADRDGSWERAGRRGEMMVGAWVMIEGESGTEVEMEM